MVKKLSIIFFILLISSLSYSTVTLNWDIKLADKIRFFNVNSYSLLNKDNMLDLKYFKNNPRINTSFSVKLQPYFLYRLSLYAQFEDISNKNMAGIKEMYIKFNYLPAGIEFTSGRFYVNNSTGNIFNPLNYYSRFFKPDFLYEEYDKSLPFTNVNFKYFFTFDYYSLSFETSWMPGFKDEVNNDKFFDDKYFLYSLQNYTRRNLIQNKITIDNFEGWTFNLLFSFIEKKAYNFTEGFYFLWGMGNTIKIYDNVKFYQEFSIKNGQERYKVEKIDNPYFPKNGKSITLKKLEDTKDRSFFIEYMAGIDILLPQDVSLIIEYFFNEKGYDIDERNEIYDGLNKMTDENGNNKSLIPMQASLLDIKNEGTKLYNFQKHYLGIQVSKLNILEKIDLFNQLIVSLTEPSFSYKFSSYFKINNFININFMVNTVLGFPKTEFGLELYNVTAELEFVFNIGIEKQFNYDK